MSASRRSRAEAAGDDGAGRSGLLARVGAMRDDQAWRWARDQLVHVVEIESFSHREHDLASYLTGLAEELGLPVVSQAVDGAGPNLLIGWDPDPGLLLTAHMDTIAPTWEWARQAEVRGDDVYGLGAQDDKGCLIACLLALLIARDGGADLARLPIGLGLTVDEEINGTGSIAMASALHPRYVVAAEGTDLQLGLAEAGALDGWVDVRGRRAHGSLPELGDNASIKAAHLIVALEQLPVTRMTHPLLGRNVLSVFGLAAGSDVYVIPDRARFRIQIRLARTGCADEALVQINEACARHDASFELIDRAEPFETDEGSVLASALSSALQASGVTPRATGMPSWTDAHSFVDCAGSQAVVFGPGSLRVAHSPQERVSLGEVVTCARVLARLVTAARDLDGLAGSEALLDPSVPIPAPRRAGDERG